MFYVLGDAPDRSAWPATVEAELYRANPIENYDTIALRCLTDRGVEIMFFASHATRFQRDPFFSYEFEKGTIHYGGKIGDRIYAQRPDGTQIDYGSPASADSPQKLFDMLESIRANRPVVCGPEAAGAQTACIYAAQLFQARYRPISLRSRGDRGRAGRAQNLGARSGCLPRQVLRAIEAAQ